jgi:hypothetical protein
MTGMKGEEWGRAMMHNQGKKQKYIYTNNNSNTNCLK